jgi:hypothetical protein
MNETDRNDRIARSESIEGNEDLGLPPQADPQLRLSRGRATRTQLTVVTLACLALLALVLYGMNQPVNDNVMTSTTQQSQQPPQTTGTRSQ